MEALMATKRNPKFDMVLDDVRVRVYATRTEYEVVFNDDDPADLEAFIMCYPKMGEAYIWAQQGRADYAREQAKNGE